MSGWTEATLRAAASWQAFKEGKSLFENGMVAEVQADGTGWQGSVKVGKRPMKVRVTVKSATHIDTHCPCSDNQRSGAVCCHAVATGLASLGKPEVKQPLQTIDSNDLKKKLRFDLFCFRNCFMRNLIFIYLVVWSLKTFSLLFVFRGNINIRD